MEKGKEKKEATKDRKVFSDKIEDSRYNRHYTTTMLSTFDEDIGLEQSFQIAKELYREVHHNYRHLAGVRFKLLGFIPAISIIIWIQLLDRLSEQTFYDTITGLSLSLLALRIIYGIKTYDARNDQLYNDLISRGRKIEDEWSVDTGIFKGRLQPNKHDFLNNIISHGRGLSLLYSSVIIGWSLIALWYLGNVLILLSQMDASFLKT